MEDDSSQPRSSSTVSAYPAVFEDRQQGDIPTNPRKTLDLHHAASSSPDLNQQSKPSLPALRTANAGLARTRTLPLRSPKRSPSIFPTLQGITFEIENLESLRRWVLGLAVGNCRLLV